MSDFFEPVGGIVLDAREGADQIDRLVRAGIEWTNSRALGDAGISSPPKLALRRAVCFNRQRP